MVGKREQETGSDYAGNSVMAASGDEIEDDDYEALAYQQRLKAALHYTVGRICEKTGDETGVQFSRRFIAALTETTFKQCGVLISLKHIFTLCNVYMLWLIFYLW